VNGAECGVCRRLGTGEVSAHQRRPSLPDERELEDGLLGTRARVIDRPL
jgi:hypothetical protein